MYKPEGSISLAERKFKQIRLGVQSAPFAGKTTAVLTAPNPVVADFDNKLSETNALYAGKKMEDIIIVPFYDAAFCDKIKPREAAIYAPNRRDAFLLWLMKEAPKLQSDQTLIIDSWTMLQEAFDQQQGYEKAYVKSGPKQGSEDPRVFWDKKLEFSEDVCSRLKTLNCHVIITFHEQSDRDAEGNLTGKVKAFMQGQFRDKLKGHFTDWFRQHAVVNKTTQKTEWLWQTIPDNIADCGTHLYNLKPMVAATWDVFVNPDKYRISQPTNK